MHKRWKWCVKPRVFMALLALLALVFASVFFAFNTFISSYIQLQIKTQISDTFAQSGDINKDGITTMQGHLPDLSSQPRSKLGTQMQLFILGAGYQILDYNKEDALQELTDIAEYLRNKNIVLGDKSIQLFHIGAGDYYIMSQADALRDNAYMVGFVNVATFQHLIRTVNISLGVIMAIGMFFCFVIGSAIANSVISPVQKLSEFAIQIGKGDFTPQALSFTDVEFNELADVMNQTAGKLSSFDAEQRTFFQNVSHELRTPLMSIRCYAEGIACGVMEREKASVTIIAQTDRLTALVEDLLFISRVDNITTQAERQQGDLRDTFALCGESLAAIAHANNIAICYDFDAQPVLFSYNETYMHRALVNLVSNALRYAKQTITLRCYNTQQGITLCVQDDGEGIAPEDAPHIFERFYKGKGGKHGIGLAIVKAVVEQYGGAIQVTQDTHTVFSILFPNNECMPSGR